MRGALICLLVFLLVPGCTPSGPPVINRIWGDSLVPANDSTDYVCDAWDWGLKPIKYAWSCDRGGLGWDSANWVRWYSPESSGPALIRAWVTDLDSNVTRDSVVVEVQPVTSLVISYSGAVKANDFRSWRDSLRIGYEIRGTFATDSGVSFLVVDDSNFQRWLGRQNFEALVRLERIEVLDSFDTTVSSTGWYNLVVDNRSEKRDRTFGLFAQKTSP